MKKISLIIFLLTSSLSFSQSSNYNGLLEELYLGRQPSPKAEAMARGQVANSDSDFGSFYNPALTSLSEGLTVNSSFSNRYFHYDKMRFNFWGASYKINKIGSIGLSRYYMNYGVDFAIASEPPYGTERREEVNNTIFTLNFSREIFKNFYAGVNVNAVTPNILFARSPRLSPQTVCPIDIGILGRINIHNASPNVTQLVQIGSSLCNINSVDYRYSYTFFGYTDEIVNALPVIMRLGGSYNIKYKNQNVIKYLDLFGFLAHVEFEHIRNSDRYVTIKLGTEITLFDILSLRAGYSVGNNFERSSNDKSNADTYGAGIKLPLNLFFGKDLPLSINLDYVNLPQRPMNDFWNEGTYFFERYNTVSLSMNFIPNL